LIESRDFDFIQAINVCVLSFKFVHKCFCKRVPWRGIFELSLSLSKHACNINCTYSY